MRILYIFLWYFFARFLPGHCQKSFVGRMRSHIGRKSLGSAGSNICLGTMVDFGKGSNISIGDKSGIGEYSIVKGAEKIEIGTNVTMGPGVMILSSSHDFSIESGGWKDNKTSRPIKIGNNCFIGARSLILAGVTIKDSSIIAAGSVVVSDVETGSVVAGVPARVIRRLKTKEGS